MSRFHYKFVDQAKPIVTTTCLNFNVKFKTLSCAVRIEISMLLRLLGNIIL